MDFDQYVRKYLAGTLSDAELEAFRDLLERVPEYRVELRQILELRSLMQDDALRLVPPRELSERVRVNVGAMFTSADTSALMRYDALRLSPPSGLSDQVRSQVADMFARSASAPAPPRPVARRRRRALPLPLLRIGSGALVMGAVAVLLMFAPTPLLQDAFWFDAQRAGGPVLGASAGADHRTEDAAVAPVEPATIPSAPRGLADSSTTLDVTPIEDTLRRAPEAVSTRAGGDRAARIAAHRAADRSSEAQRDVVDPLQRAEQLADAGAAAAPDARAEQPAEQAAEQAAVAQAERFSRLFDADGTQPAILDMQMADLLQPRNLPEVRYNPAPDTAVGQVAAELPASPGVALEGSDEQLRQWRLLAAGVMFGSGLVDAAQTELQRQESYALYLSFSLSGNDRIGIEAGGVSSQQSGSAAATGVFAKSSAGAPTAPDPAPAASVPSGGSTQSPNAGAPHLAQQEYGAVFYDRRLNLSDRWDLCGRIAFGGTDGHLLSSARAYAVYNQSRELAMTFGVSGSTLFDLGSRSSKGNSSYNAYLGLEVGL